MSARLVASAAIFSIVLLGLVAPTTAAATSAANAGGLDPALAQTGSGTASVIVRAVAGRLDAARGMVSSLGGTVVSDLPLVDGFEAEVAANRLAELATSSAVVSVTKNSVGRFEEYSYDETATASSFVRTSQARRVWNAGFTGRGVGVAVIDTGISPMRDFQGRLIHGPDLSGEGSTVDSYGHGTVMAGVIGGGGADSITNASGAYTGVAPEATLIGVKTAGKNGVVDVSTILQALHWVNAYRTQFNIRVVNLSWGTQSKQDPTLDPLNFAVQRLWGNGIVVVVSAGNSGPHSGTVTKPGDDPLVLTVGAYDDKQNVDPLDDAMSSWSSRGPTAAGLRKPDLVAPGRSLVTARSFGSHIESTYPKALVSPSYIKGSGTSQAAAVVSGLAALMAQANPSLTPDQIKGRLTGTALPIGGVAAGTQGAGRVQAEAALNFTGVTPVQIPTATGLGSIETSRGGSNVETDCNGDGIAEVIRGEIDVRCEAWDGRAWTSSAWDSSAWMGETWEHTSWADAAWSGRAWTGGTWTGRAWTGRAWTGSTWTDSTWSGRAWTNAEWTTAEWDDTAWTTAEYGDPEWTTAEYGEFATAFWGNRPPAWRHLPGEKPDMTQMTPPSARRP